MDRYQLYLDVLDAMKDVVSRGKWRKPRFHFFLIYTNCNSPILRFAERLEIALKKVSKKYRGEYKINIILRNRLEKLSTGRFLLFQKKNFTEIYIDLYKFLDNDSIFDISEFILKKLALVFVHEFVHYEQYTSNWEYYSKLSQPDKENKPFYLYLSDPLEIEAWAVETAIEIADIDICGEKLTHI